MQDDAVSEIRLNANDSFWVHWIGDGKYKSDALITPINSQRSIYAVAFGINEICNESNPSIAAELPKSEGDFKEFIFEITKKVKIKIRN